jgi:hypothetical protein
MYDRKHHDRKYYLKHRKEKIQQAKEYYYKNKERRDKQKTEWARDNSNKTKIYQHRYYLTHRIEKRDRCGKYRKTEKGKLVQARYNRKRDGEFKCEELFLNPFSSDVSIVYHHINNIITIPFPETIHLHNYGDGHRGKCNIWIEKIYGLDINRILVDDGYD